MNLTIFAERLSDLIFDNNITPTELAKQLKVDRSTINRYLSASKMPNVNVLVEISNILNASIDYLFGFDEDNYNQQFKNPPPFSQRLTELLNHFNISRYRLEKLTGISESTLYYWSIGKSTPTIEKLIVIAKALNTSIDFVLGRI